MLGFCANIFYYTKALDGHVKTLVTSALLKMIESYAADMKVLNRLNVETFIMTGQAIIGSHYFTRWVVMLKTPSLRYR